MRSALFVTALLASLAGCATDDEPGPTPQISRVVPEAICPIGDNSPVRVTVVGSGFVVNDDHTVASSFELWKDGHLDNRKRPLLSTDTEGGTLQVEFQNGESGPASNEPPGVFELHVVNPDAQEAVFDKSFKIYGPFGFSAISPTTAAVGSQVTMNLAGTGFYGPMTVEIETQLSEFATAVQVTSPTTATATFDLSGLAPGTYAVTMRNEGRCAFTKVSAFTITP